MKCWAISAVLTTTSFSHTLGSLPSTEISVSADYYHAATRSFASRNISGLSRHSFTGGHCTKVHRSAPVLQVELAIHCYHTFAAASHRKRDSSKLLVYFCTQGKKKGPCLLGSASVFTPARIPTPLPLPAQRRRYLQSMLSDSPKGPLVSWVCLQWTASVSEMASN